MASRSIGASERVAAPAPSARLRALGRTMAIAALLAVCLPAHGLSRLLRRRSRWPRRFLATLARLAGFDARVEGRPLTGDVLIVANHLSWVDIPMLAGACGARFVSKEEVARWPLIGYLADLNRTVYVARTERGRVAEQAASLSRALAEGDPVALFPEGGTGDGRGMKPFRAALLAALCPAPAGVRVQPVAIDYHGEGPVVAWNSGKGFFAEMTRLLGLPGRRRVTLTFLDPIDPAVFTDRKTLTAAARAAIADALGGDRAPSL
ncbi:lysophospholipid acyltransferase family protein [Sphingomonas sp.]|uniref:lysophospholipid acyltransferase family protein n=1 Tax=Sphingomonas sp. TaxID=28214 RepID=UPI003B00536E